MNLETQLCIKVFFLLLPFFVVVIRLMVILPSLHGSSDTEEFKGLEEAPLGVEGSNIMVLLGSGGHTGEMIRILGKVNLAKFSRTWVTSSNDTASLLKAQKYEEDEVSASKFSPEFITLHRARSVGEPLLLSVLNTLKSFISTIHQLRQLPQLPSVLLVNGPGTSVPLAYLLFGMKFFGLCNTKIIYIESLARVNLLSLSGLLLFPISNRFIVQWQQLHLKYKRAEYYGILI